jgi:hypothetical protein
MPKRIVLVSPSGQVLKNFEPLRASILEARHDGEVPEIVLLGWELSKSPEGVQAVSVLGEGQHATGGWLTRFAIRALGNGFVGANLLRVSPWDAGRTFWRGVRRNRTAMAVLLNSEIVVALERNAILTVWKIARRSKLRPVAVTGMAAALDALGHNGPSEA